MTSGQCNKVAGKTNFGVEYFSKKHAKGHSQTVMPRFLPPIEEAGHFFRDKANGVPSNISRFQQLFQANNSPVHLKRGRSDMLMYRGAMTLSFIGISVSIYAIGCMATGAMKKKGN